MAPCKYTPERVQMMWDAIAYNDSRRLAFMTDRPRWVHAHNFFDSAAQLFAYIVKNSISDVHVKPLEEGGREWVIDADFKDCADKAELMLKVNVGATAFMLFFEGKEDAVQRIMFSGNRGFHLWLKFCGKFKMDAPKSLREHWFNVFKQPAKLVSGDIRPGSFADCVRRAVHMYIGDAREDLVLRYWPDVDRDVFCNANKQIRAPFSYNYKGGDYSRCLTQQLQQRIKACSAGCLAGGTPPTSK
ncbi:late expression factor 1 [Orgyia pseudotsugata multiple nucleopolyhedrovirus]|uniref:Late expression factor 1 n=1 Tax=Orgyia pseudotsugata multicapsid polyhedrosis virus TaxID=262177 RepID=LEF1_NPVOP|nr:late expression factor 1 [Orgyia pseudotsugata multiple nucleopolyhedrovirus]Q65362.1 RecName: Full=Late expression factor 1 [Orgyia pseudotsugata multiple nucleopolyhedrovirus]pir/T10282/ late expression factor 1 - Orgyia pseudotsugata nuclear polyhedrosis virus [Orgyia pseudotsugata single capsid nuclopolyhedrovirus]AAB33695.1 lef-1 product [Orgyia pseudotsugata multinucleocapsid nuclear polyhedrosis virus OpMNPV, Lymantria dispar/IPLB-Ld-652Y cells, Peptide Partial, 243 aa] [Orgyia pseudot